MKILLLQMYSTLVLGWGRLGHEIIADIAQEHMRTNLSQAFNFTHRLASIASWPDDIKRHSHKWDSLHYVNIKNGSCNYVQERDCGNGKCIVTGLDMFNRRLHNNRDQIALSFVTHLVGDIHQPLHVTDRSRVGNDFRVRLRKRKMSFHSLWDSGLLTARVKYDFEGNGTNYKKHLLKQAADYNDTRPIDPVIWANETASVACNPLIWEGIRPEVIISEEYFKDAIQIIEAQIVRAGLRLAKMIDCPHAIGAACP